MTNQIIMFFSSKRIYGRLAIALIRSVQTLDLTPLLWLLLTIVIAWVMSSLSVASCEGSQHPTDDGRPCQDIGENNQPDENQTDAELHGEFRNDLVSNREDIRDILEQLQFDEELEVRDLENLKANPAFERLVQFTLPGLELVTAGQDTTENHDQVVAVISSSISTRSQLDEFLGGPLPESKTQMLQIVEPIALNLDETLRLYEQFLGIEGESVPETSGPGTDLGGPEAAGGFDM